jgi:hypothetical protein
MTTGLEPMSPDNRSVILPFKLSLFGFSVFRSDHIVYQALSHEQQDVL